MRRAARPCREFKTNSLSIVRIYIYSHSRSETIKNDRNRCANIFLENKCKQKKKIGVHLNGAIELVAPRVVHFSTIIFIFILHLYRVQY